MQLGVPRAHVTAFVFGRSRFGLIPGLSVEFPSRAFHRDTALLRPPCRGELLRYIGPFAFRDKLVYGKNTAMTRPADQVVQLFRYHKVGSGLSDQGVFKLSRVGSGRVILTRPDPRGLTRLVNSPG